MTPMMAEHCLSENGLDPDEPFDISNTEMVDKVIQAALLCKNMVSDLENLETIPGYIIYEESKEGEKDSLLPEEKQSNQIGEKESKEETKEETKKEETPTEDSKKE